MSEGEAGTLSVKTTIVVCIAILLGGLLFTQVIFSTEPEAEREAATKRTAMLVDVIAAEQGDFKPEIIAMGTVQPSQEVALRAQVSGTVLSVSNRFMPGGFVAKGETLLQIDPADYRTVLQQRESDLTRSLSALAIEQGEHEAARLDYERLNRKLSDQQKELILRRPQLRSAEANVAASRAALARAKLDLDRTQIQAPFDAQILQRNANVGSTVNPNDTLAQLIGLERYWVEATVPVAKLAWLQLPYGDSPGSRVQLRDQTAWPDGGFREGTVKSVLGTLQGNTRMARVIIEVEDPMARQPENQGKPVLLVGSFLECAISAKPLQQVVKIARDYVRKNNTAWVMAEGALQIRDLDIVFSDSEFAYVRDGLAAGDKIVVTDLSRVRDGAELRLKAAEATGAAL